MLKCQKGFLIIETLIAVIVISIALVAIGNIFIQSVSSTKTSDNYVIAANLAQQQIETLKRQPPNWNNLNLPERLLEESTNNFTSTFIITVDAIQCVEPNSTNLVEVIVTINWTENGRPLTIAITEVFSRS